MEIIIRSFGYDFWPDILRIYESGISTGDATFETKAPDWEYWDKNHRKDCRLAAVVKDKIVGWAALSNVSVRSVYCGVAEVSVYVDNDFRGKGIGTELMKQLIKESERVGVWTLQSGIFPENRGSIYLHEKFGFRKIGYREKIGKMNDVWRDVLLFERRSKISGI